MWWLLIFSSLWKDNYFPVGRWHYVSMWSLCAYYSTSDDDKDVDDVAVGHASGSTTVRLRRSSVPVYGQGNKSDSSDDADSVVSLHRDSLYGRRRNMMWRQHWQPPASEDRLHNADRNNNSKYSSDILCCQRLNVKRDCPLLVFLSSFVFIVSFSLAVSGAFYHIQLKHDLSWLSLVSG